MDKHEIKFYPVGNGDTSLITLDDETTILIDCHIRDGEEDTNGNKVFPVKEDLLSSLKKRNEKPFVDLFILTHSDKDHCLGFEKHFHIGNEADYDEEAEEAQKIVIGELWITSRVYSHKNNECEDAKAVRREALRRKELYDNNEASKESHGNKLRIIGYDGKNNLESVPHYIPGEPPVNLINQANADNFEIFIHAPFKEELQQADPEKNNTSIAFQARFKDDSSTSFEGNVLFSGDADHNVWERILNQTENHDNEEYLYWDIFLAPHHCSWSFFNDRPYENEDNQEALDTSKRIIGEKYRKAEAYVIASSKLIKDDDDNPPHYPAKAEYVDEVGDDNFKNTSSEPNEQEPKPLIFEFISNYSGFEMKKNNISAGAFFSGHRTQRAG